jgi:hypothetical protein
LGKRKEKPAGKAKRVRQMAGGPAESSPDLKDALIAVFPSASKWSSRHSYLLLFAITVLILVPFSGKAFHVDDTLFVLAAKQIANHPLDPYGFEVVWNTTAQRMSDVTENPPLASYYAALVGRLAGWSERALHLAFVVPALALVVGTYRLGLRCTRLPLLATLAALFTPGVLVSATSVMCDTTMAAFWVWAVVVWVEGLDPLKPHFLLGSSLLIAASALTKYYGIALIPLLLAYSLVRLRSVGRWILFFLIPVFILIAYELWTAHVYGQGLIEAAASFAARERENQVGSTLAHALVGLSFAGGCAASVLALSPILWSRGRIVAGLSAIVFFVVALNLNWLNIGLSVSNAQAAQSLVSHWKLVSTQLSVWIVSGLSILAMVIAEVWARKRDAMSWLLAFWVLGTLIFAAFMNWTVNARSVLPMIPAVGLLIFRRLDGIPSVLPPRPAIFVGLVGMMLAAVLALLVTTSDFVWANSAREAANRIYQKTRSKQGKVYFAGHWGFQYYMQAMGFVSGDVYHYNFGPEDSLVVPFNNTGVAVPPREYVLVPHEQMVLLKGQFVTTMDEGLGAGFYSSNWGPLPFVFGPVSPERYETFRVSLRKVEASPMTGMVRPVQ